MAQHYNMFDLEAEHAKFDRGRNTMPATAGFKWRHKVCHVAQCEDLTGHGIENCRWIDSAVAAGNDHDWRRLAFVGQMIETLFLLDIGSVFETAIPFNKRGKFRHQKRSPRTTCTSPTVNKSR